MGVTENVEQTLVAELGVVTVLGLVQSVGIEEQRAAFDGINLLTLVDQTGNDADGDVRANLEHLTVQLAAANDGRVVAGIAIAQAAADKVDQSDEQRDKHVRGILVARQSVVHACTDFFRRHLLGGQCAEQPRGLRHEQRGGNTLAAHVAQTEIEAVARQQIAVQVAADLLGRSHRGIHVESLAVGEHAGQHRHLDVAGYVQLTLYRRLLRRSFLQFFNIVHQRLLHVTERLAQLADLVGTPVVRQFRVEMPGGDSLCLLRQPLQGFQLAGDDTNEEHQHQQQSHRHDRHDRSPQAVETSEDVALRTDDGHAPPRRTEGFVEHIAVLPVDVQLPHAFLAALHGMTQGGLCRVGLFQRLGEDGLVEQLRGVRVHEIGATMSDHDAVRIGIGLHRRNGLRQPV